MKKIIIVVVVLAVLGVGGYFGYTQFMQEDPQAKFAEYLKTVTLTGSGATFPEPLYKAWALQFEQAYGTRLDYKGIGSGGGIKAIKAKEVLFGASDSPLEPNELDAAGLIQFPMTIGGVVPVINLAGFTSGDLKLTGEILADIFLGKITKWNDPAIVELNSGKQLPDTEITVVHRSDSSGTTWIFTNYLCKVSKEWKEKVGNDKKLKWPVGREGEKNDGVAKYVKFINGAIGYVEYAYAVEQKLTYPLLKNKAGQFVPPTASAFQYAAANAFWESSPGFYVVLTDQPGEQSWPIVGASFILVHKEQADADLCKAMLTFFEWSLRNGAETSNKLNYVHLPSSLIDLIERTWTERIRANGKPVWE
ncbi:MAG: phosphate ABC transporter substrate-binding protein PstS [Planctomycetota bacterium]